MDKGRLLLEIKSYFGKIVIEKYLFKNVDCLILAIDLVEDLTEIAPSFTLFFHNGFEDDIDFKTLPEEVLEKMLTRLQSFDNDIDKFRKVN